MKNAFKALDCNVLLSEVKAWAPILFPYAWACYHRPNKLFGSDFELDSSRGVQQGDVCGPVLFAIAPHKVGLYFQFWYLDDGILCGSYEAVGQAMNLLKEQLSPLGLELNLPKCKVFGPNVDNLQHPGLDELISLLARFFLVFQLAATSTCGNTWLMLPISLPQCYPNWTS